MVEEGKIYCDECGKRLTDGDMVYRDGSEIYCTKCAGKMLFEELCLYDEGDVADFDRKDRMVWTS